MESKENGLFASLRGHEGGRPLWASLGLGYLRPAVIAAAGERKQLEHRIL